MKKIVSLIVITLLFSFIASCASEKSYESIMEIDNGSRLKWGNRTYTFYSAVPKDSLIGKQIAIIDGDKKHKVFEVKGYSKEDWIIEHYDVIMSVYSLYKADNVTDIPTELQQK